MADKRIIDRIKKLLALAKENTNAAEATAAATNNPKNVTSIDGVLMRMDFDEEG